MAKESKEKEHDKSDDKYKAAGLFIPAGLFIGFAAGFAFNNVPVGMFAGLGFGFLLFAFAVLMKK
jgi:hypothetical protein